MKKRLLLICIFVLTMCSSVLADAQYMGDFVVKAKLDGKTDVEIAMSYYGDGPVVVMGETVYHRKNGTLSNIRVYGMWDGLFSQPIHLYEFSKGELCGIIDIRMTEDPNEVVGPINVNGEWHFGGKTITLTDATLESTTDFPKGCRYVGRYPGSDSYRRYIDMDWTYTSGVYGYTCNTDDKRFLSLQNTPDSTKWSFVQSIGGVNVEHEFRSDVSYGGANGVYNNCWTFTIGKAIYDVTPMQDVLLVSRRNPEVEDNSLPHGVSLAGVYPRQYEGALEYKERELNIPAENKTTYSRASFQVPYIAEPALSDSVRMWISDRISSEYGSYQNMALACANSALIEEEGESEMYENGNCPFTEIEVGGKNDETKNYVNITISGYDYMGGAHGFAHNNTTTFDRRSGDAMTYERWFTNTDAVEKIVSKAIIAQNSEVDGFFMDDPPLPGAAPYYDTGDFIFQYSLYEIAPYVYGMLSCMIPAKTLMPYLTPQAKALIK